MKEKLKTDCYKCKYRKELTYSVHSKCIKPDINMTGHKHGIEKGWFSYPINFDPVWRIKECDNFEEK